LDHAPLFQVMLALDNTGRGGLRLGGLEAEAEEVEAGAAKFDLTLSVREENGTLSGALVYSTDLFDEATASRLAAHFERLLRAAAHDPARPLSTLPLLSPAERRRHVQEWNRTARDFGAERTLDALVAEQAARTPAAVAVMAGDEELSYAELEERAEVVARYLRSLGVGAERRVGVLMGRGVGMVVGVLGVLKAGGAYVPLDAEYPAARLRWMAEDAGLVAVVTEGRLRGVAEGLGVGEVVSVDEEWGRIRQQAGEATGEGEEGGVSPENLAYVIYTSGSTGRPKGVGCSHRGVVNLLADAHSRKPLAAGDVCSFWTSLSFDVSVYEIFSSLSSGATLNIVPEEVRAESGAFVEWLALNGITSGYVPAFALAELSRWAEKKERPSALRRLLVGVEPIEEELLAAIQSDIPGLHIFNGYGPTEATIYATLYPVPATCDQRRRTPVGRPIANTQAYVLDRHLESVPVGVAGELYLGGEGLARGYLNRPALTAEKFIPDPFSGEPGARLYRTGDLARHLPDGELVFVGRRDEQLKVRGFRVEAGEVEAALEAHPLVRASHVMSRADDAHARLVAYVSAEPGSVLASGELRRHLKEQLPEYMIPSAFVTLDTLPLTPGGKVDRGRLPAPEGEPSEGADSTEARTPTEELVAGIWCEVLGRERVGTRENFFEAGGHSLLATQIVARARAVFGVELPLRALFEHPTVAELSAAIDATARSVSGPPIRPAERGEALPMSFAQQRLWFLDQLEPGNPSYNQASAIRFRGELNSEALEQCLNEIVRRHEVLRTVFTNHEGHPRQVIIPSLTIPLRRYDLRDLRDDERESELRRLMNTEGRLPFDLARGPLLRITLIQLDETEHVLLFTTHHIVSDGWSMGVLIREAGLLYDAFSRGADSPLPELPVQYADYAVWQASQEENHRAQLDYWVERLADAPPLLALPTDRPRPSIQTHRGASVPFALSQELMDSLRRLARRRSATLFMVLLAGLKALLLRYTGETDLVVGTPVANRTRSEVEGLVGFFVNTLALRTDLSGDPTFAELLARVRDVALGAYAHQEVPFERVVEEVRPERSLDHAPLFQVMLALDNTGRGGLRLGGLEAEAEEVEAGAAKFDLT
ncbi:MAG TPA: amino acid adenylation domain-containing protein, partial [Pyrinomonadaceae bacterium]|nr:amino acid adenylation domain-containing protein [Pyrinomonadaceae bacterium]